MADIEFGQRTETSFQPQFHMHKADTVRHIVDV